ncbi:MAG: hypothetical protein ACNA7W_12360 [Pseudomonadales bacterium]
MKDWMRTLALALVLGLGGFGLAGCDQGPFEEAGEEIDDTVDDVEDAF